MLCGVATLSIGRAYDWTPRGHQDMYDCWAADESALEMIEERSLPLYVVYAAQSDMGTYIPDQGQRIAANNRSYIVNNDNFNRAARGLFNELKPLKGQTVSMEIQGNVVYALHTLPSGSQIAVVVVPQNQRLIGVGEETRTDNRGRARKVKSGPMTQIANIGGIATGKPSA